LHQWESEQGRLLKAISAYKQSEWDSIVDGIEYI
jgi:hypothetical protein